MREITIAISMVEGNKELIIIRMMVTEEMASNIEANAGINLKVFVKPKKEENEDKS